MSLRTAAATRHERDQVGHAPPRRQAQGYSSLRPLPCQGDAERFWKILGVTFPRFLVTEAYWSVHPVTPKWYAKWYAFAGSVIAGTGNG
jgi:hypothetical protein